MQKSVLLSSLINYVAGTQGWRLDKNGTFEINGVAGGGRMIINNQLIRIYTVTMSSVSVWGYGDAAGTSMLGFSRPHSCRPV